MPRLQINPHHLPPVAEAVAVAAPGVKLVLDLLFGERLAEREIVLVERILVADHEGETDLADGAKAFGVREQRHEMARHDPAKCVAVETVEERVKMEDVQRQV